MLSSRTNRRHRRTLLAAVVAAVLLATTLSARPAVAETSGERVAGPDHTATSLALSVRGFPAGADVAYLASEESLAVVPTAGSLRGGPILVVPACGDAPASVVAEVNRLDPERVIGLGGEAELCAPLARAVSGDRALSRLPGPVSSAYATPIWRAFDASVALAERAFPEGAGTVYLAAVGDPRSTSAAGMLVDGPTLVIDPSAGTFSPRSAVEELQAERVVALGDAAALPDDVLAAVAAGRATGRLGAGDTTALAVSDQRYGLDGGRSPVDTVYLTSGDGAAVQTAATALADGPVLPVPGACEPLPPALEAEIARLRPRAVVAVGGEDAVCDSQLDRASTVGTVEPRLTDVARILTPQERAALTSSTGMTLRFDAPPASLVDVAAGSVVVSEPSPGAPKGLLRRVIAVTADGAALELQTEQAAIGEALADGVGGTEVAVTPEQVDLAALPESVSVRPQAALGQADAPLPVQSLVIDLDQVVHDVDGDSATTGDRVVADGTLELALVLDTSLDARGSTVQRFRFAVELQEQLDIAYSVGPEVSGAWEAEVATIPLQPVRFFAGIFPVVVVPEIRVAVGAATGTTVGVEFSGEQTLSAGVGAEYTAADGWRDISGLTYDATGTATVPSSGATADRTGSVTRVIAMEVYGTAGPNVFAATHLELRSRDGGAPQHQLAVRNEAGVAVAVDPPFLGTVAEYQQTLFDQREELWRHPSAPVEDLSDVGGDVGDARYDLLEHRVDFFDTLDLSVRIAEPRPVSAWSPDDAVIWRVAATANEHLAYYTVVLEPTDFGTSVIVLNDFTSISCNLDGGVAYDFDGTWHSLSIDPSCLIVWVGGPYSEPTSVEVGVETYRWGAGYTKLDHDTAPDGLATDRYALNGPIPRGGTETFCEPSPADPTSATNALTLAAAAPELPSPYSFYVQTPFAVPALASVFTFDDGKPEVYLRYGEHDECKDSGFGWAHIVASHRDDFQADQLSDEREQALREALANASVWRTKQSDDGESLAVSLRGRDSDGVWWVIVVSNRIDDRDPYDQYLGFVTAYRG